jgi:hypothetical protein
MFLGHIGLPLMANEDLVNNEDLVTDGEWCAFFHATPGTIGDRLNKVRIKLMFLECTSIVISTADSPGKGRHFMEVLLLIGGEVLVVGESHLTQPLSVFRDLLPQGLQPLLS